MSEEPKTASAEVTPVDDTSVAEKPDARSVIDEGTPAKTATERFAARKALAEKLAVQKAAKVAQQEEQAAPTQPEPAPQPVQKESAPVSEPEPVANPEPVAKPSAVAKPAPDVTAARRAAAASELTPASKPEAARQADVTPKPEPAAKPEAVPVPVAPEEPQPAAPVAEPEAPEPKVDEEPAPEEPAAATPDLPETDQIPISGGTLTGMLPVDALPQETDHADVIDIDVEPDVETASGELKLDEAVVAELPAKPKRVQPEKPVDDEPLESAVGVAGALPQPRVKLLAVVAAVVLGLDVLTKIAAVMFLEDGVPIQLFGGLLYLSFVRNPGAAFGLGEGMTWVLALIALGVVGFILWISRNLRSLGWALGLGGVLGGAVGNLIDRIFRTPGPMRGHVVDFLSLLDPYGQVWPVFNVADMAIVCGGGLIVYLALRQHDYDGTVHKEKVEV